jgi:hypothetical protein
VGVVLSRRFDGPCSVVRWDEAASRYVCGALGEFRPTPSSPDSSTSMQRAERLRRWMTRRLIAAGEGCDCDAELDPD